MRTLLIHSGAPATFWAEALNTATYLLNRRLCRAIGILAPHDLLLGTPPRYDDLPVFGCLCFPNVSATATNKLSVGEVGLRKHCPRPPALAPSVCLRLRSGGTTLRCTGH
jgi:hypothetical protein